MDGVDKIKKQILLEAQKEIDKLNKESKSEISELKKANRAELNFKKDKITREGDKQAKLEKQRVLSNAKLQAHNLKLQSREKLIQDAFSRAMDSIQRSQAKGDTRYKNSLKKLIKAGKSELGVSKATVSFNAADSKKLGKAIAKSTGCKLGQTAEIGSGVVVKSAKETLCVDNSFERRFERQMDILRNETAKTLFGGSK